MVNHDTNNNTKNTAEDIIMNTTSTTLSTSDQIFAGNIVRTMENVNLANEKVRALAEELGCAFLNLNAPLMDEDGYLRLEHEHGASCSPTSATSSLPCHHAQPVLPSIIVQLK